jgi:hypothetical protein
MKRPLEWIHAACAFLAFMASHGCYHMYSQPYGTYGGYSGYPAGTTYPPGYPAPIQTLTPGTQPYVPGGATYPSTIPQGTQPTYQSPSGGLQPVPENNAPPYNGGNNQNVPNPYYPSTYLPPGSSGIQPVGLFQPSPFANAAGGMQAAPAPLSSISAMPLSERDSAYQPVPVQGNSTLSAAPAPVATAVAPPQAMPPVARAEATPIQSAAVEMESFAAPKMGPPPAVPSALPGGADPLHAADPAPAEPLWNMQTNKIEQIRPEQTKIAQAPLGQAAPAQVKAEQTTIEQTSTQTFARDAKFAWLRGVVSKEPQDGTWSIIYDDQPADDDKWAGHLSLAPSPELDNLKDGDVVELHGQIDAVVQDRQGKPVYVVTKCEKPFATPHK